MLEAFFITIWLEIQEGQLRSYHLKPTRECKRTIEQLFLKFKDRPEKLIAVKCDTIETLKQKKEMFD
jgi:hypothetical protein